MELPREEQAEAAGLSVGLSEAAGLSVVPFPSCLDLGIGIGRVGVEIACEKTCEKTCGIACGVEGAVTLNKFCQVNPAGMQFENIISS